MTQQQASPPPPPPTYHHRRHHHLLTLPSELRTHIYELYFADTTITIHPATVVIERSRARKMQPLHSPRTNRTNPLLAPLQVCRQMHAEASQAFYATVLFHVDIMVARPFVPVEALYRMRRVMGGAEVAMLFELDGEGSVRRKQHAVIGPFDPARLSVRELDLAPWMADPVLGFMVDEANREVGRPVSLEMYLSVYNQWVS